MPEWAVFFPEDIKLLAGPGNPGPILEEKQ
jgi:hypothetical protein